MISGPGYGPDMARRIREEYIDEPEPITRRRVVTEHRFGGGMGYGRNPAMAIVAALLVVFILVMIFGRLG